MTESLLTGPKINPERNQREALQKFFEKHRHTDIALALLDDEAPSFVISSDLAHAVERHRTGIPLEKAILQEREELYLRYVADFRLLPNKHNVSEFYVEKFLRKKIEFDWSKVVLHDYKYEQASQEASGNDKGSSEYLERFMALFVRMLDADQACIEERRNLAEFIEGKGT
jgi:hypothetical protein